MKQLLPTIILILFALSAFGQIFVKSDASGAVDGSSWTDAFTELSDALSVATEGDEIWVAEGTYLPGGDNANRDAIFFLDLNIKLYGGFDGTESSLTDRGNYEDHPTILSGDVNGDDIPNNFTDNREDNCRHIMWTDTMITNETIIDGFFFQNGHTEGGDGSGNDRRAGAILSYGAPIIRNCTFTQNYGYFAGAVYPRGAFATGFRILNCNFYENEGRSGGCIYIVSLNAGLVESCSFTNNKAVSGSGIYNASAINTIRNCTFENNTATSADDDARGGGIYNSEVFCKVENCTFLNNEADFGGGIYSRISTDTILNCTFLNNFANSGGRGAGVYIFQGFPLIENCNFSDNSAADRTGGGIHFTSGDDPTIAVVRNCSFDRCEANWGGAVAAYSENTEVTLEDCEFNFNTGFANGGCLTIAFAATVNLNNCMMSENNARFGGAIFMQNDSSVLNAKGCNFITNQSENSGGVFHASTGAFLDFQDCYFENNSTSFGTGGNGGAISFIEDSLDLAQINIARCEFIGNYADGEGGALRLQNTDTYIENSVFAFNMTGIDGSGGAIINNGAFSGAEIGSPLRLVNNTFSLNQGGEADGILMWADPQGASSVSLQNNAFYHIAGLDIGIQDGNPDIISTGGNVSLNTSAEAYLTADSDILDADPLFMDINLLDFSLQEGSPCIDAGVSENAPSEDIEGNERDENPDAGAYEYQIVNSSDNPAVFMNNLVIFPTVTKGQVQLWSKTHEHARSAYVRVFDQEGRRVWERKTTTGTSQISEKLNLGSLHPGTYIVELTIDGQSQTRRIIKM